MNRTGVERRHEVRSPPHRCGGNLPDSSGRRMVKTLSHESRRGRSVGVNAAAIGTSGPGIRTPAISDAPFSRRGRDLESVDPLRAGQEHRTGRLARQGLPCEFNRLSGWRERGFKIGIALSKRDCQARLETAGPHLRSSVLILRDEYPHVCSQSLEGCRLFGTRGLLPPGFEVSFLSSVRVSLARADPLTRHPG